MPSAISASPASPASQVATTTDGPITPAAMPILTKMPVPRIEPSPMNTAPGRPTTRSRRPALAFDDMLPTSLRRVRAEAALDLGWYASR